jgi:hypothetical protein
MTEISDPNKITGPPIFNIKFKFVYHHPNWHKWAEEHISLYKHWVDPGVGRTTNFRVVLKGYHRDQTMKDYYCSKCNVRMIRWGPIETSKPPCPHCDVIMQPTKNPSLR